MENNKYDFDIYVVRSRKLHFWLKDKGFKLEGTAPSRDNLDWVVYFFKNSQMLRNYIDLYREINNKSNQRS